MPKEVKPLRLRQSDDGKWEVENISGHWIECKNEADAKILSNAPIVRQESYEIFHPNEKVAAKLDKTADVMERYDMFDACRFFRKRSKLVRGKLS